MENYWTWPTVGNVGSPWKNIMSVPPTKAGPKMFSLNRVGPNIRKVQRSISGAIRITMNNQLINYHQKQTPGEMDKVKID